MGAYHCCNSRRSSELRVLRPRCGRAGVLVWDAEGIEALLWVRSTALFNGWLLPTVALPLRLAKIESRAGR